jgi:hypothetical protein
MEDRRHRDGEPDERQQRGDDTRVRPSARSVPYSSSVMAPFGQPFAAARTLVICLGLFLQDVGSRRRAPRTLRARRMQTALLAL